MSANENTGKFQPSPWVPGGHMQTLWRKFAPVPVVAHRRERLELRDGDFIDLDWNDEVASGTHNNGTLVLILHGLCGCSKSSYVQSLQYQLGQWGCPSVAMNFRGCSGVANRLAKAYHSGVSDDLGEVFNRISERYSNCKIALTGFSLGANVLLKWLGESDKNDKIHKAVAVSTPFKLSTCSATMTQGLSQFYGRYFLRRLVREVENKKAHFRLTNNLEQLQLLESLGNLSKLESLWQFDNQVTAVLHGFENAEDYYEKCSSIHFLSRISTPTLLLQSYDDPIIPSLALPNDNELSQSILTDWSDNGGHVGFASANGPYWLENRIIRFLIGEG